MSVQLLDKTRKINKLLHNSSSSKVVFNDICQVLMETLSSNILVLSKKGKVLGVSICPGVDEITELIDDKIGGHIDPLLNERFLGVLSTKENVNLQTLGFEHVPGNYQGIALNTEREFTSIFATNPDPVLDAWFMAGRQRFGKVRMLNRADGVKPIISTLRKGGLLYLLPDMDYGKNDSVFVPFFAVPETATIPSLSRFARLGKAKVVGLYNRMTPDGYVAEMTPAWDNFPTEDHVADTARMNRELEAAIRTMIPQYYWVHRRFKTRPDGQESLYKK